MIDFNQCDSKRCTGRKLSRFKLITDIKPKKKYNGINNHDCIIICVVVHSVVEKREREREQNKTENFINTRKKKEGKMV